MIKSATRRFMDKKGQWYLKKGSDSADKHALDKARRNLDEALCHEGLADMIGDDPEPKYYAVENVLYDEDDWFPGYFTAMVFDRYDDAAEFVALRGGWIYETTKKEFDDFETNRESWEMVLRCESLLRAA